MRGLHARKGRKGFRKNAIFPRPGRQRMSSAHESGYPNEIQYGNVEDHLTFFTRVHCLPSRENAISPDNSPSVRFSQVSDMAACCMESRKSFFTKGKYKNRIYVSPDMESILEQKITRLITRRLAVISKPRSNRNRFVIH